MGSTTGKWASAQLEILEPRCMLSLPNDPTTVSVQIGYSEHLIPTDNIDYIIRSHITWIDSNSSGTTYRVQWAETANSFPTDVTQHIITGADIHHVGTAFEAVQILDAGQRRWYRVRAESADGVSNWVTVVPRAQPDSVVQVTATADSSGVHLHWVDPVVPQSPNFIYRVFQKPRASVDLEDWTVLSPPEGFLNSVHDLEIETGTGQAYEYLVQRFYTQTSFSEIGYVYAGSDLPLPASRGNILLVIDSSVLSDPVDGERMRQDLATYTRDLIGERWRVYQITVDRDIDDGNSPNTALQAPVVKQAINSVYDSLSSSGGLQAIDLIGHVPVPYSGVFPASGIVHDEDRGAWPADTYYTTNLAGSADLDAGWIRGDGLHGLTPQFLQNENFPDGPGFGDGKFDTIRTPDGRTSGSGALDHTTVGRIDFANLNAMKFTFPNSGAWTSKKTEMELLHRYFVKNHLWRTGDASVQVSTRAMVDDSLGMGVDTGWLTFSGLVGAENVQAKDWESTLHADSYLFAAGAGSGSPHHARGVTDTETDFWFGDHIPGNDHITPNIPIKAVFVSLFGSQFGDWNLFRNNQNENLLRCELGMAGNTLAVSYSGSPFWYFHTMGLGETIGDAARLTQVNYIDDATNGQLYSPVGGWVRAPFATLMGDPTLPAGGGVPSVGLTMRRSVICSCRETRRDLSS